MAKAGKPPKVTPTPTPSDPIVTADEPRCWPFVPDDQSSTTLQLKVSDSINGSQITSRILLNSKLGFVGYVPSKEAGEMVEFIKGTKKRLVGQVLSNDGKNLLIELCAI